MTRDEYVAAVKSALITLAKNSAMIKLVAAFPFLATGPLNSLAVMAVGKVITWGVGEGEVLAFCEFIDLRTSAQGRTFEAAILAHKNAKPEEQKNAEKALIDAARVFIKLSA